MNNVELMQRFAQMPASELLPYLTTAETSLTECWPYSAAAVVADKELAEAREEAAAVNADIRTRWIALTIMAVLSVICLVLRGDGGTLGSWLLMCFVTLFVLIGVIAVFGLIGLYAKKPKCAPKVAACEQKAAAADAALKNMQQQHQAGIEFMKMLFPEECWRNGPKYVRLFVSYFETGRAATLNQARDLFETHMHRERMEGHAAQQTAAAVSTMYAAQQTAANTAAAAASAADAANSARQTYYNTLR